MPLHKISIAAPDAVSAQAICDVLGGADVPRPHAITRFEHPPHGYLVEAYHDDRTALEAIERALAQQRARVGKLHLQAVPDENWVAVSQAALPAVGAGRFVLHGSHDRSRFAMRRHALEIDAGEAFGTGHNATTTLCLRALDRLARRREFRRVVDVGCGTGVLAIAAARAFPDACVTATDNDPVAVAVARQNVLLNRLGRRVGILEADGFEHPLLRPPRAADLVLANILPGTLMDLACAMRKLLLPRGIAILSGLLAHQVREVAASYRSAGFALMNRQQDRTWAALTVARR